MSRADLIVRDCRTCRWRSKVTRKCESALSKHTGEKRLDTDTCRLYMKE